MDEIYEQVFDDLVGRSGTHRYSRYFVTTCLFHEDRSPSMFVYPDGYRCQSCGAHGSIEYLHKVLRGKPHKVRRETDQKPRLTPYWSLENIEIYCLRAHENLLEHWDLYGYYLTKRGVGELVRELYLGYGDGYYTFPIFNTRKSIVGAVGRAGESRIEAGAPRYSQPNGQKPCIINPNFERNDQSRIIYVPYGIIDMLTLYQLGYPTMCFSSGKYIQPDLFQEYRKRIVLIPDKGEESNARKLWSGLGWRGTVLTPDWPQGCKDPNEIYMKFGEDTIRSLINVPIMEMA